MTAENCGRFVNLWISLLTEEKTWQRVAKAAEYDFMEHDNLNLPWKFDMAGGYRTLPVVIWLKKRATRPDGLRSRSGCRLGRRRQAQLGAVGTAPIGGHNE